jgi:hypothetical protein
MTLTIPPELEAQVQQQALSAGMTLESWLQMQREIGRAQTPVTSLQDQLSPEEWVRQFHEWAESHDRTTPLLSDEAISRESIYSGRI